MNSQICANNLNESNDNGRFTRRQHCFSIGEYERTILKNGIISTESVNETHANADEQGF